MNDNNNINTNDDQTHIYRVLLTPLGNFFFGGQKQTEVENEKDYYIKSLYYPPQTVILGMLRQELLIQNGLFPLDKVDKEGKEKAVHLIGEASFDPTSMAQEFGVIEELSPVFIMREKKHIFHISPMDYGHTYKCHDEGKTYFNHPEAKTKSFIPDFAGYDAKEGNPVKLISKDSPHEAIDLKDVFIQDEQIGIKKGKSGQTEEEGYYKQVFLRLKKEYTFAFYLKLKTEWNGQAFSFNDNMVFIGGERSGFKMEVENVNDENKSVSDLFHQSLPELAGPKILLTGDAFVEPQILNQCDFAVSKSVFSRNFRSYVQTTRKYCNLTDRKNDKETPFLGDRYNLLARGTVLYYHDRETLGRLTALLDTQGHQKIGFNYYKIYPSQEEKGKE